MTKFNLLLLVAVMASAFALIRSAYDTRRLFAENHRAEMESRTLAGEHTRLEAERQLQATNLRVERTAREKLQMRTMTPAVMMFEDASVSAPPPAVLASAPAAGKPRVQR
jgi:cell division protein FtsL